MNIASFYMERKQYLENLKRKRDKDSSPLFKRTVDILTMETEDGLRRDIEDEFSVFQSKVEDDSSFQERLDRYLKTMEEEFDDK